MKKIWMGALFMAAAISAHAGVAISVGQPGFYGHIVLGEAYPAPQVVYPQPVMIQPPPVAVVYPPLYLRVPPGHMKQWARYCGGYGACGRQVYFVKDAWYQNVYVPRYNAYSRKSSAGRGPYPYHDHDHDHDHGKGGGPGKGHGRGHGHGKD